MNSSINNLFLVYEPKRHHLIYKIPSPETSETTLLNAKKLTPVSVPTQNYANKLILQVPEFEFDPSDHQLIFFLLDSNADNSQNIPKSETLQPLIFQMQKSGEIKNLLQDHKYSATYRVIYFTAFNVPNTQLTKLPNEYIKSMIKLSTTYNKKDVRPEFIFQVQNSGLKLFYNPYLDTNILANLNYDFVQYLARFSDYLQNLITSEEFYQKYIETHYGKGIWEEKEKDISPVDWIDYISRNENILFVPAIIHIIKHGYYHLLKYLLEKHDYNSYLIIEIIPGSLKDDFYESIGKSGNMKIVDFFLDIIPKDPSPPPRWIIPLNIIKGACSRDVDWYLSILNKLNKSPKPLHLLEAFTFNNLELFKYLYLKYKFNLQDTIISIGINFSSMWHLVMLLTGGKKCYPMLQYVFEEKSILDINYFKNLQNEQNLQNEENYKEFLANFDSLAKNIGQTSEEEIIQFFISPQKLDIFSVIISLSGIGDVFANAFGSLITGICKSGNVKLLKEYIQIYKQQTGKNEEDKILLSSIPNLIRDTLAFGNLDMILYLDSLQILSKYTSFLDINDILSVVYSFSIKGNVEIVDFLLQKFPLTEDEMEQNLPSNIIENGLGLNNNDPGKKILEYLRDKKYINPIQLIRDVLFDNIPYNSEGVFSKLIWILNLKPNDVLSNFVNLDEVTYPDAGDVRDHLIKIHYFKEEHVNLLSLMGLNPDLLESQ